jgi:hypothetical protein
LSSIEEVSRSTMKRALCTLLSAMSSFTTVSTRAVDEPPPDDWVAVSLQASSRLVFGDPTCPRDGLQLPLTRWPAISLPCFLSEGNDTSPVVTAGRAQRASLVWTAAGGADSGVDMQLVSSFSIWGVARVGETVRHELLGRFRTLLARSHNDISVMSPALVASPSGGLAYFSRITGTQGQGFFGSVLWHSTLSHDLALQSPSAEVPLMTSRAQPSFGGEDPRALLGADGSPLVVFNAKVSEGSPRSMFVADIATGAITQLRAPNVGNRTQKNWAPFWYAGALHFLFSAEPLTVLRCALPAGDCECVHAAGPAGCADLRDLADFRVRLGSPLTEIGDSGVFFTALHSQVRADNSPKILGYRGHLALLSTQPWGWLAVSSELATASPAGSCSDPYIRAAYSEGIDYPTSALLVGPRAESVLLGSHFNDGDSTVQQIAWDEPLIDVVAVLTDSACLEKVSPAVCLRERRGCAVNESAAAKPSWKSYAPCVTTSRHRRIGRCAAWTTLGSLSDVTRARAIAPLRTLDDASLARRRQLLQGNE